MAPFAQRSEDSEPEADMMNYGHAKEGCDDADSEVERELNGVSHAVPCASDALVVKEKVIKKGAGGCEFGFSINLDGEGGLGDADRRKQKESYERHNGSNGEQESPIFNNVLPVERPVGINKGNVSIDPESE